MKKKPCKSKKNFTLIVTFFHVYTSYGIQDNIFVINKSKKYDNEKKHLSDFGYCIIPSPVYSFMQKRENQC